MLLSNFEVLLPGQLLMLQGFSSRLSPMQGLPSTVGVGLLHIRALAFFPEPQVLLQAFHVVHSLQSPST